MQLLDAFVEVVPCIQKVNVAEDGKNSVEWRVGQCLSKEFFIFGTDIRPYTRNFSKEIILFRVLQHKEFPWEPINFIHKTS